MRDRVALLITAVLLATALGAPSAFATSSTLPVALEPGEKVLSHTSTSSDNGDYVRELLTTIEGVKIAADKTTVLVADGDSTHPIEIEYGQALSIGGAGEPGGSGETGGASGGGGGLGLGQIAGLLLGLTVVSRVVGILRQLTGTRR